ncbi:MAG: hypothetical protein WAQ25_02460 [Candidatus Saccharimonas sp.]
MVHYIPTSAVQRFASRARHELRPQLEGLDTTTERVQRVRALGVHAGFLVQLDWGSDLPHPAVSAELLNVAADHSAAIDWLAPKLTLDDTYGCWAVPMGDEYDSKNRARYPTLSSAEFAAKGELAHRFVVRRLFGSLTTEQYLDHLCRAHACCNPMHLEIVTHTTNVRRGVVARSHTVQQHRLF